MFDNLMSKINQIDLNLVRVFVAVMELRSTTRAGEKLGLSQSAVSHALNKLRQVCDDPLFLRTPSEMHPTPRAEEMAPALRAALHHVELAFGTPDFDPMRSDIQFSIAVTDYVAAAFFPPLMERIRDRGYTVSVALRAINELNIGEELDQGRLHLAVGIFRETAQQFIVDPLARVDYVWVMRQDHPAAKEPFDLETLALWPHLDVRLAERPSSQDIVRYGVTGNTTQYDALLAERGLTRRVGAVTGHLLSVAPLLARSDMLACVPERMAREFAPRYGLVFFPAPYPSDSVTLGLIYHRTLGAHPAAVWLRKELHELAASAPFETAPPPRA